MTVRPLSPITTQQALNWIEPLARLGYAARGVIYLLIGGLALLSALGNGGSTEDSRGALDTLMQSPGGWIILLIVGVGLIGYAIWRFVQGTYDPDHDGTDAKGLAKRGGKIVSGVIHVSLAMWAISRAIGNATGGSGGGESQRSWTAWLLEQPFGRWLVVAVAVAILCAAVGQFIKGFKEKFKDHYDTSDDLLRKLTPVCRFGLMARGVVFGLIASFFFYAAWTYDAEKAGGLTQAFETIRGMAFGQILLAVTALGMLAYAVYSFIEAYYRRIETPTSR